MASSSSSSSAPAAPYQAAAEQPPPFHTHTAPPPPTLVPDRVKKNFQKQIKLPEFDGKRNVETFFTLFEGAAGALELLDDDAMLC